MGGTTLRMSSCVVAMLGGEYFFAPSIPFLRELGA
jgi:hypothetical protein